MKLNYHSDTDSLYIDLSERTSVESREISDGIVLDYDAAGNLVGIDIDNASKKVALQRLVVNRLPVEIECIAGQRPLVLMAATGKQVGGRSLSYLLVRRGRPPAFYGSGHSTAHR